jgi:putative membrane protein
MWWYGPGDWMGGGFLFMLFFWVLIIVGAVVLVRSIGNQKREGSVDKTPLEILKERYAKGEIDKKEYEEKKKELS